VIARRQRAELDEFTLGRVCFPVVFTFVVVEAVYGALETWAIVGAYRVRQGHCVIREALGAQLLLWEWCARQLVGGACI
jgi:hypothetical protein